VVRRGRSVPIISLNLDGLPRGLAVFVQPSGIVSPPFDFPRGKVFWRIRCGPAEDAQQLFPNEHRHLMGLEAEKRRDLAAGQSRGQPRQVENLENLFIDE